MIIREENQTKKRIMESLFELLDKKDYHDITVSRIVDKAELGRRTFYRYFNTKDEVILYTTKLLMNEFAETILMNHAESQESIIEAYFEFWENHIEILLLWKKAYLLYFIEDNLMSLIYEVAVKTGHISSKMKKEQAMEEYEKYKYAFTIKLGGIWKATTVWCSENPRKSPKEMSRMINDIMK